MKKIVSVISILILCTLMIIISIPISNAQVYDKPSPCTNISLTYMNYQNGYNGYYIEVTVPDTYMRNGKVNKNIKGFQIQTVSAKGKVVNSYYPSNLGSIKSVNFLVHALKDVKKKTYRTSYFPTRNESVGYKINVK